jgi:hypothetical protein
LHIAHGPHDDTQLLQLHAFQWFNHHLKDIDKPIDMLAESFFDPEQLRVFDTLPADEINTRVHEMFVPAAPEPKVPESTAEWQSQREVWLKLLREKCFGGWPVESEVQPPQLQLVFDATARGVRFRAFDFDSQPEIKLRLYLLNPADSPAGTLKGVILQPLSHSGWLNHFSALQADFAAPLRGESLPPADADLYAGLRQLVLKGRGIAYIAPRGVGPTVCCQSSVDETHVLRRLMLLGQTLDGMRVWDVRRGLQALRSLDGFRDRPIWIFADREMAGVALYASLFEPAVERLHLGNLPSSHRHGPDFLNVLRILDVPQALAMTAKTTAVMLHEVDESEWKYPVAVAKKLGCEGQIDFGPSPADLEQDDEANHQR